ncbi:MAG: hypothetical protein M0009_13585 [Deltaproteobacteria bacterium]|nr:hypothetical protein [Deltaproteobacteria bacterium]
MGILEGKEVDLRHRGTVGVDNRGIGLEQVSQPSQGTVLPHSNPSAITPSLGVLSHQDERDTLSLHGGKKEFRMMVGCIQGKCISSDKVIAASGQREPKAPSPQGRNSVAGFPFLD